MIFEKGDIIVCVKGYKDYIIKGNKYKVISVVTDGNHIYIVDELGYTYIHTPLYFKKLSTIRNNTINDILD